MTAPETLHPSASTAVGVSPQAFPCSECEAAAPSHGDHKGQQETRRGDQHGRETQSDYRIPLNHPKPLTLQYNSLGRHQAFIPPTKRTGTMELSRCTPQGPSKNKIHEIQANQIPETDLLRGKKGSCLV